MQVCNPTAPAQYFHLLRRQLKRGFRKPLVLLTPKSLLRHKAAVSPVDEFTTGCFHEILDDTVADAQRVRRVVLCSGKIFYDLVGFRNQEKAGDVAIVRLEQLYPFPHDVLQHALGRYHRAKEWVWAQEESQNMGAWSFVEPQLQALGHPAAYVGRDASASPATGSHLVHVREQKEVVEAAIRQPIPHVVQAQSIGLRLCPVDEVEAEQGISAGRAPLRKP
jgi:2-oxoglutarate dehydrogenase E1 component